MGTAPPNGHMLPFLMFAGFFFSDWALKTATLAPPRGWWGDWSSIREVAGKLSSLLKEYRRDSRVLIAVQLKLQEGSRPGHTRAGSKLPPQREFHQSSFWGTSEVFGLPYRAHTAKRLLTGVWVLLPRKKLEKPSLKRYGDLPRAA